MKQSPLRDKSFAFAVQIVKQSQNLQNSRDYVMSNQVLRSGTSIGANIHEAEFAQTKLDFIYKLSVSLKEANETEYWLMLLKETGYINQEEFNVLVSDCREIRAMLISSIKTAKSNLPKK